MPSAISVNVTDTFEQWRLKTNQISIDVFDAVRNVHEDLTPSLGGDLYLNNTETGYTGSFDILGTGNINITGTITSSGNISGADIIGSGDLAVTGAISGANFIVSSINGNVTGSNWSVDGASGDITATTFSGDLEGTINTVTTGTTQAAGSNDTRMATNEYVDTGIGNISLNLASLTDTTVSAPAHQHLLMYNSGTSKWENQTILGAGVPNQQFTVAMAVALGY